MDLLAALGFTDYRFSIEWARIEPAPGEYSRAAVAHYRRMVEGAIERGLRPMVTLHHFAAPRWFMERGGWAATGSDEWGRYEPTFGLIAVDHRTFTRTPKPSAAWLGAVGRSRILPAAA